MHRPLSPTTAELRLHPQVQVDRLDCSSFICTNLLKSDYLSGYRPQYPRKAVLTPL